MNLPVAMKMDVIWELVQKTPTTNFMLVLFMSLAAALLINHIIKIGFYTTLVCIPALLFAGIFANAALVAHGILLGPDKASNIALSATVGFVVFASTAFASVRVWTRLHDKR